MPGEQARRRLRAMVESGGVLIGAGAGTGLSAKCAEAGGADLIIIYNSGRYRMAGRGSLAGLLPYGDANAIVMEMAGEGFPVVDHTPVLAGVLGTDPVRPISNLLRDIAVASNAKLMFLCKGGPIAEAADAAYVLERTHGVVGFFGASSMERLPTEVAITETVRRFKALKRGTPRH